MEDNKYKGSLSAIQSTIANYDNKAGVLLTAVGIVFGFSLFSIQELSNKTDIVKVFCYIFGILYLLAFVASLIILVLIVFPRGRNKKEEKNKTEYPLYSDDLYNHVKNGDIDSFTKEGNNDSAVLDQIKVCSRIAHTKEVLLKAAVISIITFTVCLVSLVICLVI